MLRRDEIKQLKLIRTEDMSEPPDKCFDITSYNLRLGKQYCLIHGQESHLEVRDCSIGLGILRIPPFACALVSSDEYVLLPDDIYGRWGLKIRQAMSGLVFQAGPQIEPGSHGRLFGLIFNLSSNERQLRYREPMWSIDFEKILAGKAPSKKGLPKGTHQTEPELTMQAYMDKGIPTGSLNEIYADYRKLHKDVQGKRDIAITALYALVTLICSLLLPVVVTKLTYDKDDSFDVWKRHKQLEDDVSRLQSTLTSQTSIIEKLQKALEQAEAKSLISTPANPPVIIPTLPVSPR